MLLNIQHIYEDSWIRTVNEDVQLLRPLSEKMLLNIHTHLALGFLDNTFNCNLPNSLLRR